MPTNFAGGIRPADGVDAEFLLLVFRAAYEIGLPWLSIKQTTGLQNLDLGNYLSHAVPLPSPKDQRQIAARMMDNLRTTRQLQASIQTQIELLLERRQALITAAVTGELEIPGVAA